LSRRPAGAGRGAEPAAAARASGPVGPLPKLVALMSAAVLLAGCSGGSKPGSKPAPPPPGRATGSTGVAPRAAAPPKLTMADCTQQIRPQIAQEQGGDRNLSFSCGRMPVPLDHAAPDGPSLQMVVLRARLAGQSHRIGSLVINPGGPGGSGVQAAIGLALELPEEVLRRFDVVGFDPRGVGASEPIACVPAGLKDRSAAADPDARTDAEYAEQVALAREAADDCYAKYGDRLGAFNTTATARDLELLRQALGEPKLTYLGYSYGTLIGAVYATLYPDRIRAFVLDGAVDPTAGDIANTQAQARGFEDAFNDFARDCTGRPRCPLGSDPRAFITRLIAKAKAHPVSAPGDRRRATGGNVLLAAVSALYNRGDWPKLAQALADADRGDARGVLGLDDDYNQRRDDGTFSNLLDANYAVNCADTDVRLTGQTIRGTVADWRRRYPLFGPALALSLIGCQVWKAPRHPLPRVSAPTAPAILVVGTRHDPATPYASAQRLTGALGHAVLLSWDGDGHTAYPKTGCITRAVDAYLISVTVPAATGATCPAG
jgi:pimeloyl-ACP methyl ester carboxylesterase